MKISQATNKPVTINAVSPLVSGAAKKNQIRVATKSNVCNKFKTFSVGITFTNHLDRFFGEFTILKTEFVPLQAMNKIDGFNEASIP